MHMKLQHVALHISRFERLRETSKWQTSSLSIQYAVTDFFVSLLASGHKETEKDSIILTQQDSSIIILFTILLSTSFHITGP